MNIQVFNKTNAKVSRKILHSIEKSFVEHFPKTKNANMNLILFSKGKISELNKQLFNKQYPTDVISVPGPAKQSTFLGDVYICPQIIRNNAEEYAIPKDTEFARVTIHGILHLLDFDHTKPFGKSKEKMFRMQEEMLQTIST